MNGRKYPRETERVNKDGSLCRLMVPGGWILIVDKTIVQYPIAYGSIGVSFMADPDYQWALSEEK